MLGKTLLAFTVINLTAVTAAISWADHAFANRVNAALASQMPPDRLILAQTEASARTEGILRKTIQDLQQGNPDLATMEPELQAAVKEQSQSTADIYRRLGPLQTLKYLESRNGADIYRAVYQNAAVIYTIRLSDSGKISELRLQPAFPWE